MSNGMTKTIGIAVLGSMLIAGSALSAETERGRRHRGHKSGGPGRQLIGLIHTLEYLSSETAPATFTPALFPDQDTNADGTLSNEEWETFANATTAKIVERLVNRVPEADTDSDGTLSSTELQAFVEEKATAFRKQVLEDHADLDADGDGVLSASEFEALEMRKIQRVLRNRPEADLDGDGTLTMDEFTAGRLSAKIQHTENKGEKRRRGQHGAQRRRGKF